MCSCARPEHNAKNSFHSTATDQKQHYIYIKVDLIYSIYFLFNFLSQNKDLKSRVTHLEGSQKTNQDSLVSKLNSRIQELEERLQGEER